MNGQSANMAEDKRVDQANEATVTGDGPATGVTLAEARQMDRALDAALRDPAMIAASGAPHEVTKDLPATFADAAIMQSGQVRAGEWLLTSAAAGLRWELRMLSPEPPRIGLVFHVPLERTTTGWRATSIVFVRIR